MDRDFLNIAAIIRTYNNNRDIEKSARRALGNGVGIVIVVVNAHDEATRGNVRGWLSGLKEAHGARLVILEMTQGYTWANALNLALAHIRQINRIADIREAGTIDHVLPVSNEVLWEREHLRSMVDTMQTSDRIGVVGTSFKGRQSGNEIGLGTSYVHPRCTMMLIRRRAIEVVGHFDALCDGFGGMEDLHFVMNMTLCGNFTWRQLDLTIPLLVGINHDQKQKEAREQGAMRLIVRSFRDLTDGIPTLQERVERMLRAFQIDDL